MRSRRRFSYGPLVRGLRVWWTRWSGVRARTAGTAALVVTLALGVGAVAMLLSLDRALVQVQRDEAELVADRVGDVLLAGAPPAQAVGETRSVASLVQVLDRSGAVLAASVLLDGLPPLTDARPGPGESVTVDVRDVAVGGTQERVVVTALGVGTAHGDLVVVVGETLGSVQRTADAAAEVLTIGILVLAVVATLTTYVASGRALRPVEAMRRQVEVITDRDLDQRIPVPPTRDEVGRLAVTLNAMLARLRAAQTAQRQFVADASHELRSPLSTIVAGLELVSGRTERDASRITAMREDADRVSRLVEDLLLLARADEHGPRAGDDEVDLDEIFYAEQLRLRLVASVRVHVDVGGARVRGDRGQLTRLVRNLVDNAMRYRAAAIELLLRADGDTVVLGVGDDGPGIPVADRERVLGRFVRLDAGRTREGGGAGLGLAIVAEVARAHHGEVTITESRLGGALVTVRLPAAR
jgi:signal transduction histidine kinase